MINPSDTFLAGCSAEAPADALVAFRLDTRSGALARLSGLRQGLNMPIYIAAHPNRRGLYLADVMKECDGVPGGAVAAVSFDARTGQATVLNRKPARGTVPCYVSVARDGRFALVANYGDGSVSVLPIGADGLLGDAVDHVQHEPATVGETGKCGRNAHSFIFSPDGRFAFAADLGIDAIFVYRFDSQSGRITPHEPAWFRTARKAGPRHLAFDPAGRFLYAVTEYDNTVIVLAYEPAAGKLSPVQVISTLPAGYSEKSYGADLAIHPGGRLLYATNRGHDSIAIFAVDPATGRLTSLGHQPTGGSFPRSIVLDSTGRFLVCGNEKADRVVSFALDPQTGKLTPTGSELAITRPSALHRL